jgi:hypothetical protein
MDNKISRRELIKGAVVAGASTLGLTAAGRATGEPGEPAGEAAPAEAAPARSILPLTSTSDVYVPPREAGFFKFSFDFPEPSVEFGGLLFSFRVFTFENAYAPDSSLMSLSTVGGGLRIRSSGFVWAGGQQKASGELDAGLRRNGDYVEWQVSARMDLPIKSIATILRGVPRGRLSAGAGPFFDPKDGEHLFGYPFGGGSLFTATGMDSPIMVIQSGEQEFFALSTLIKEVRANRFYLQPGAKGYRVEMIFERQGWSKAKAIEGPVWRAGRATSVENAYRPYFEHLEKTFGVPDWENREDVPAWFREIALVVAIHGMHWSGYIFNDFAKTLRTLEWVATQIPGRQVLVFLPAWDGRYYWNYPIYKPDERLGGEQGFRGLIDGGHKLGFRFMPMFGMNSANKQLPVFKTFSDAATEQVDGDAFGLNWVDWDNDRHLEGWGAYLNLGVESWRKWLSERIADVLETYHADGYFLDIAGGWENNTKADMHEGARELIGGLRKKFPDVLACGEMPYDVLMSVLPLFQVFPAAGYPAAFRKYCRAFQHLSLPAPGRGSSGVHESGFGRFNEKTLSLSKEQIPTITVVDDTLEQHEDLMAEIIRQAKQRLAE